MDKNNSNHTLCYDSAEYFFNFDSVHEYVMKNITGEGVEK